MHQAEEIEIGRSSQSSVLFVTSGLAHDEHSADDPHEPSALTRAERREVGRADRDTAFAVLDAGDGLEAVDLEGEAESALGRVGVAEHVVVAVDVDHEFHDAAQSACPHAEGQVSALREPQGEPGEQAGRWGIRCLDHGRERRDRLLEAEAREGVRCTLLEAARRGVEA